MASQKWRAFLNPTSRSDLAHTSVRAQSRPDLDGRLAKPFWDRACWSGILLT